MTRPSRGDRRSATTTRQTGSFFPPTRVRRMETDMTARQDSELPLPHQLAEVGHLPRRKALHHLAHLTELLDELVDLLDGGAGALGDPLPAPALDQLGPAALLGGHRQDDRLDAVELALVDLQLGELVPREARDHPQQRRERAHRADPLELVEEVLERELVLAELLLERRGLVLVDGLLGLLDEREDVAHAED